MSVADVSHCTVSVNGDSDSHLVESIHFKAINSIVCAEAYFPTIQRRYLDRKKDMS